MATDDAYSHRPSRTGDESADIRGIERLRRVYGSPWLFAAVVAVMVGDVVTTTVGLERGLSEANPVVADAIETYGVAGMVVLKTVGAAILLTFPLLSSRPRLTFQACCVLYGGLGLLVVCWNTALIVTTV